MKTVSKKLLSLLLVALLLAAAVPFQAFATDTSGTADASVVADPSGATEYTVRVVVKRAEDKTKIAHKDIKVSTESPVTKSQIDDAANAIASDRTIISYSTAAGSPLLLSNATDVVGVDPSTQLDENGRYKIIVVMQSNTPTAPADYITLTLDAGAGATIGSPGSPITIEKNANGKYIVPTLPTASKSGYNFLGWFVGSDRIENGTELTKDTTATASYELITKNIKVKGVKTTQSLGSAWLISEYNATPNQNLLDFVKNNATSAVQNATPVGYQLVTSGGSIQWYDYTGSAALGTQAQVTDTAQEVLVKYQPKTFTLYFQVDGGSVSPTSKTVTYDSKVGTLPTPTRTGDVFLGWFDGNGVQYTSETVYKVNGDTTLYARWQSESTVLLRIYLDPNTTTPDRIVDITGKVVGNSVSRSEVETIVTKYYTGSNMKLVGLFSDATWTDYKAGTRTEGTSNVTIQEDVKTTNVYVVVKNATNVPNSNSTTSTSTTATTKAADSDNPQTGDPTPIYAVSGVMILAAAALVVIQILRKKRTF